MDTETRRAAIVTALVQAGATIEGAAHVAGYTEEEILLLVRGDMVDGVDQ
jgi:predicted transcriptional regulator